MKGMVWKELRENAQWAVLATLIMGLIDGYAAWSIVDRFSGHGVISSLNEVFADTNIVAAPLFATVLGFLQVLPELRRDRWAFLVHRPMTRVELLWGKAAAGLALYLAATLIPYLLSIHWLVRHVTLIVPFHWRMLLPNLSDIFTGTLFYFTALLVSIRPARWYGSRWLPLAAALQITVIGMMLLTSAWSYFSGLSVGLIIVGMAAWGSFLTDGHYQSQPRLTRAALASTLWSGIIAAGLVVSVWLISTLQGLQQKPINSTVAKFPSVYRWSNYNVTRNGIVVRETATQIIPYENASADKIKVTTRALDLAGKPIKGRDRDGTIASSDLAQHLASWSTNPYSDDIVRPDFRNLNEQVKQFSFRTRFGEDQWVYDDLRGIGIHYRVQLGKTYQYKLIDGYCSPLGFSAGDSPPHATFQGHLVQQLGKKLRFGDDVYYVDFEKQHLALLASSTHGNRVRLLTPLRNDVAPWKPDEQLGDAPFVILRERDVLLFNSDGSMRVKLPIETILDGYFATLHYVQNTGYYFLIFRPFARHEPTLVDEYSSDGTAVRHLTLPYLPRTVPDNPPVFSLNELLPAYTYAAAGPVGLTLCSVPIGMVLGVERIGYWKTVFLEMAPIPGLAATATISILLSILLVITIARRCAFSRRGTTAWIIESVLLGPSAVLLLLALREWPAREGCPTCKRKRVVDRELCEHCGAPWPAPEHGATEIFERSPAEFTEVAV